MEEIIVEFLDFSAYDFDTWISFLKTNWFVIAIALVVLLIVVKIVKTIVKWAIVAVIVIGLVIYSGYSMDDLKELGTKVTDTVKQEAVNALVGEAEDATYKTNADGSFTVTTKTVELKGKAGSGEVEVSLRGASLGTWKVDGVIQSVIDQAKKSS